MLTSSRTSTPSRKHVPYFIHRPFETANPPRVSPLSSLFNQSEPKPKPPPGPAKATTPSPVREESHGRTSRESSKQLPSSESHKRRKVSSRDGGPDRSKDRERHSSHHSSRTREREHPSKSRDRQTTQIISSSTKRDATSDLYFSDRRGDRDIERYGTLNRYEVPRYRSCGYGYVMGLPLDRKIDRILSTDKATVISPISGSGQKRLLSDRHALKNVAKTIRFVKVAPEEDSLDADFIALSRLDNRRNDGDDEDANIEAHGPHTVDYRRLDLDTHDTQPADPDAEYESDTVSAANPEITRRNAALVRQTRDHPEDITAWISLIEHQESMMVMDRISPELTSSDKHHLAELRISIYEQALRKFSTEKDRQAKLYAGLMSEAIIAWDVWRWAEKWTEILAKFPSDTKLWAQYLDDIQSDFTGFTYEKCRDAFLNCFKTLTSRCSQPEPNFLLYMLVRFTRMCHEAGYHGLAIGIWQAMLEFHLLKPGSISGASLDENFLSFEEFWDSDVARIGEEGAKGWSTFDLDTTPKYPGRSLDDVEDDDLLNVVLFSDLRDILERLSFHIQPNALVNAFLCFCGMPPIAQDAYMQKYRLDPFLQHVFSPRPTTPENRDAFVDVLHRYSACPLRNRHVTTEILFDDAFPERSPVVETAFLRRALKLLTTANSAEDSIGVYLLALESAYFPAEATKTAKRLLKARPTNLFLYNAYGLVESKRGNFSKADQVFSTALSMQQQDVDNGPLLTPGSLALFNSWVWGALRRGDHVEALWRLTCPTGQLPTATEGSPSQTAILRARTLLSEITSRALISDNHFLAVTSTSLSALLAYLSTSIDAALSIHSNIAQQLTTRSQNLDSHLSAQESHAQSIAALLTHHTIHAYSPSAPDQKAIVKPSLLRHTLEPLLQQFPSNTVLLALYAANEARFALDDRVRDFFTTSQSDSSIISSAFAIHHEQLRARTLALVASSAVGTWDAQNPTETHKIVDTVQPQPHATRALFSSTAQTFPHCPALRKAHTAFELGNYRSISSNQNRHDATLSSRSSSKQNAARTAEIKKQADRLREVYIAGLKGIPWCKDYMDLGIEIADLLEEHGRPDSNNTGEGLRDAVKAVMGEKGLNYDG
ncbi:unnamed protein product [Periconia digitata]|uniref:Uncharacterized protein n=1 Tax=Periconia digitata TaxID=1303443 RepID=A0A9W4UM45_9PLEO|nr:unnamed protein product [Periconia digitata]